MKLVRYKYMDFYILRLIWESVLNIIHEVENYELGAVDRLL